MRKTLLLIIAIFALMAGTAQAQKWPWGRYLGAGGSAGGSAAGRGTMGYLPKWLTDTTLGDSPFSLSGNNLNMYGNKIVGLGTPSADNDAATKAYVDTKPDYTGVGSTIGGPVAYWTNTTTLTSSTAFRLDPFPAFAAELTMGGNKIVSMFDAENGQDAATLAQVNRGDDSLRDTLAIVTDHYWSDVRPKFATGGQKASGPPDTTGRMLGLDADGNLILLWDDAGSGGTVPDSVRLRVVTADTLTRQPGDTIEWKIRRISAWEFSNVPAHAYYATVVIEWSLALPSTKTTPYFFVIRSDSANGVTIKSAYISYEAAQNYGTYVSKCATYGYQGNGPGDFRDAQDNLAGANSACYNLDPLNAVGGSWPTYYAMIVRVPEATAKYSAFNGRMEISVSASNTNSTRPAWVTEE